MENQCECCETTDSKHNKLHKVVNPYNHDDVSFICNDCSEKHYQAFMEGESGQVTPPIVKGEHDRSL